MPKYRIRSGDMDHKIETPFNADAQALALIAISNVLPANPGTLVEVTGGQFKGDDKTYLLFSDLAQKLGRPGVNPLTGKAW